MSSASPEFLGVAQAQFNLLGGLQVSRAAVYLRHEGLNGALEFIPVAVWPEQGVWVVGRSGSAAEIPVPSPMLPGGAAAELLLPDYPFIERSTGPTQTYLAATMADAGLSVPLVCMPLPAPDALAPCDR